MIYDRLVKTGEIGFVKTYKGQLGEYELLPSDSLHKTKHGMSLRLKKNGKHFTGMWPTNNPGIFGGDDGGSPKTYLLFKVAPDHSMIEIEKS